MANEIMKYETIMIFNVNLGEESINSLADRFKKMIESNGTLDNVEEWGKRKLAYPINDEIEGYYFLIHFTSKPDFPKELDRVYNITDGILRSLIVRREEEDTPEAKAAPVEAEAPKVEAPKEEAPAQEEAAPAPVQE